MNYITVLQEKLQTEIEHSRFLEELLKTLYGEGWDKLTLFEAKKWRERHLTRHSSGRATVCPYCQGPLRRLWECIKCGQVA